ncbi:MAG: hypothetical protein NTY90_05170 [Candidatus Micrarchaeota archaeon]|nr:hypothetical protein [Candidatus Micrarchaeota archaeon]
MAEANRSVESLKTVSKLLKEQRLKHEQITLGKANKDLFKEAKKGELAIKLVYGLEKHMENQNKLIAAIDAAVKQHETVGNFATRFKDDKVTAYVHFMTPKGKAENAKQMRREPTDYEKKMLAEQMKRKKKR